MAPVSNVEFHFFGNGKGESTILKTPLGWGVVDSFTYQGRIPTLDFLKSRGVTKLHFLALTHPHEDHFAGMDEIVEYFSSLDGIQEFWRYPGIDAKHLFPLLEMRSKSVPEPRRSRQLAAVGGLKKTFLLLGELIKGKKTELKTAVLGMELLRSEAHDLEIRAISPPGSMSAEAEQVLADAISSKTSRVKAPDWDLNKLSFALQVRESGIEAVLGGDTPAASWEDCISSSSWRRCEARVLKCPHHGSTKDNKDSILDQLHSHGSGLAVLTRYSPSRLPRASALNNLPNRFARVLVLGEEVLKPSKPGAVRLKREFTVERLSVRLDEQDYPSLLKVPG